LKRCPLQSLIKIQEIIIALPDVNIPEVGLPSFFLYLDIYLIKFTYILRITFGLNRNIIIADGCIISDAHLERAVIGVRSTIQSGATIRNSIVMGADYYEQDRHVDERQPAIGIGRNCVIDRAIIDKNARIADGVVITPEGKPTDFDGENYFIRDGIVIVPKNAIIPAGFWI